MNNSVSAWDALAPAFRHTFRQLFQPFRFSLWWRLALVGLAAGDFYACGGGGGGGATGSRRNALPGELPGLLVVAALFALFVLVLILLLVVVYVASVARFALFDIVLTDRYWLWDSWKRWQRQGFSLFVWVLCFLGLFTLTLLVIAAPALVAFAVGSVKSIREHIQVILFVFGGCWLVLVALAVIVTACIVWVLTRDFVVPIMALERIGTVAAWRRFWPMLSLRKGDYAVYLLIRLILTFLCGVFFTILAFLMILLVVLVLGAAGLTVFWSGILSPWVWDVPRIALTISVGTVVLTALVFALACISNPATAFFPTYAAYFLRPQYPRLAEALREQNPPVVERPA